MPEEYSCHKGVYGKREAEREGRPCDETNEASRGTKGFLQQHQPATRGSLGFDLATTVDTTLTDNTIHKIPRDAIGPLIHPDSSVGALLVGRSSAGVKGLIVLPGVIDADDTGLIYIMAYTVCPPLFVPKGSCIAQIIAIDNLFCDPPESTVYRQDLGFGSAKTHRPAMCFTAKMTGRPMMTVIMSQGNTSKQIVAMLDTGADVTIISRSEWPRDWSLEMPTSSISGVRGQSVLYVSKDPVTLQFPETQQVNLKVYVMSLPGTLSALIGHDVLSQLGAVLTTLHFR